MRHNFKSQVVLDPSLLADTSIFDKIAFKPKVSNYVLLINLDNSAESCLFAENIANQLQAKVVSIKAIGLSKNKFDLIVILCINKIFKMCHYSVIPCYSILYCFSKRFLCYEI